MSGLFDDLERGMTSPLFLAGANLAFGNGMGGAMQGLQQGYGIQKMRRDEAEKARRQAEFQGLFDNPETVKQFGPMAPIMRAAGPDQGLQMGGNFLMQQPGLAETRRMHDAQIANMQAQRDFQGQQIAETRRMNDANLGTMKFQTPEGRAAVAQQYGLQPGTPAFQQFVLSGQLNKPDPLDELVSSMVPRGGQQPPAAMSPAPSMPGPRLIPQSAPVDPSDPNFIRTQAAPGASSQPAQPPQKTMNTPLGAMSEDQARRLGFALALKGKGDAGNMMTNSPEALGKEARNEVDKRELNAVEAVSRLDRILSLHDDAYNLSRTKIGMAFDAAGDKLGLLSPDKQVHLEKYTKARAASIDHLNTTAKELSGATITPDEAKRILLGLPNPGFGMLNGVWDGDSPAQFRAKIATSKQSFQLSIMRQRYLRANGFTGDVNAMAAAIPLDSMPTVIQQRTEMLQKQMLDGGAAPADIPNMVRYRLRKEFGI